MSAVVNSPHARDIASLLHGMTNPLRLEREGPLILEEGDGVYVRDLEGNEYIEGMAGLWCAALGFSNERLIQAAVSQMRKLPTYHTFFQRSTMPTIDLAERLLDSAPVPMARVWFANSGSEANDHMCKFVWYYNNARGKPEKKKIIAREHGYHGIAVSSGSLTGLPAMHKGFDLPIPNILHTGSHNWYRDSHPGESEEAFASRRAEELEQLILAEGPETVAAFVAEPVLGAGGAVLPPRTYFEKIQAVLAKYDVLMVADEVITGFFRTGKRFACETYGIRPDILVVAKQLSSAYLPISAVVLNEKVYGPIRDLAGRNGILGTGFTYSGHPVSAAVALEAPASELVRDADSVTFCLSKGLSCPVGSVIVGSDDFIERSRRWRKMVGGGMRQAGVLAAAGIVALDTMIDRLAEDHANARKLSEGLAEIPGIGIDPDSAPTNLVFFEVQREDRAELYEELSGRGVLGGSPERRWRYATHYGVTESDIDYVLEQVRDVFSATV